MTGRELASWSIAKDEGGVLEPARPNEEAFSDGVGETRESRDFFSFLSERKDDFLEGFLLNVEPPETGEFRGGERVAVAMDDSLN